jgi:hypothetical protein
LQEIDARQKHIVLLSDGIASRFRAEEVVAEMRAADITLSAVAIGSGSDTEFLWMLADMGQGRYYFTERSSQIPRIASRETSIVTGEPLVEGQSGALVREVSPLLRGLAGEFPAIEGYVGVTSRERAVTALVSDRGDPLLAHWQFGLGRVVAWTSGAAGDAWAGDWSSDGWADGGLFWPQMVQWTMPAPHESDFRVSAEVDADRHEVVIRAESLEADGAFANFADTRATILLPDDTVREVEMPLSGPGSYAFTVETETPGRYHALVQQFNAGQVVREEVVGFVVPELGTEYRTIGANQALLDELMSRTDGRTLSEPATVLDERNVHIGEERIPLWPWFVGLAAVLVPFDVLVRRLRWRRSD